MIENKEIESALKEMFPKNRDRDKASRCISFLLLNGGVFLNVEKDGGCPVGINFYFDGYGIEFTEDQIVFIGDEGDFADIEIDYYTLLGYMMHMSMLSVGFKRAYNEREEPEEKTKCPHCGASPLVIIKAAPRDNVEGYRKFCFSCLKKIEDKTNLTEVE